MGIFKRAPQPEPVDRDRVMRLIKAGMDRTDAHDADLHGDSPRVGQAEQAWHTEASRSTKTELARAYEALTRHGY
jgi:hypothetical protein